MKVVAVEVVPYARRLSHPVTTSAGVFVKRSGSLLRLQNAAGTTGVGDAAWWPGFGSASEAAFAAGAARVTTLAGTRVDDAAHLEALLPGLGLPPEWAYAFELACLDVLGHEADRSVAQLLCAAPRPRVPVHALVGSAAAAQEAVRRGARAVKLKVGARLLEEDVLRVGAVRAAIGGNVGLRVDANGAWTRQTAIKAMRLLAAFSPEWLEQPVAADDIVGLRALRAEKIMPVAADESVSDPARLQDIVQTGAADVVVLKPMALGGIGACRRAAQLAGQHGVRVAVTHALESGVGRLGALHLAAALSDVEPVAGLGGALEGDAVAPAVQHSFLCDVPTGPGLGAVGTEHWHEVAS